MQEHFSAGTFRASIPKQRSAGTPKMQQHFSASAQLAQTRKTKAGSLVTQTSAPKTQKQLPATLS
ncbi:MAG TPA: hypothetical protein VFL07_03510 [Rudaea sp.]|nr:hypothetical protein [Rudaea sp.]